MLLAGYLKGKSSIFLFAEGCRIENAVAYSRKNCTRSKSVKLCLSSDLWNGDLDKLALRCRGQPQEKWEKFRKTCFLNFCLQVSRFWREKEKLKFSVRNEIAEKTDRENVRDIGREKWSKSVYTIFCWLRKNVKLSHEAAWKAKIIKLTWRTGVQPFFRRKVFLLHFFFYPLH